MCIAFLRIQIEDKGGWGGLQEVENWVFCRAVGGGGISNCAGIITTTGRYVLHVLVQEGPCQSAMPFATRLKTVHRYIEFSR